MPALSFINISPQQTTELSSAISFSKVNLGGPVFFIDAIHSRIAVLPLLTFSPTIVHVTLSTQCDRNVSASPFANAALISSTICLFLSDILLLSLLNVIGLHCGSPRVSKGLTFNLRV